MQTNIMRILGAFVFFTSNLGVSQTAWQKFAAQGSRPAAKHSLTRREQEQEQD